MQEEIARGVCMVARVSLVSGISAQVTITAAETLGASATLVGYLV